MRTVRKSFIRASSVITAMDPVLIRCGLLGVALSGVASATMSRELCSPVVSSRAGDGSIAVGRHFIVILEA